MLITATLCVTLLLTLILPLYPTGLDPSIMAFLVLATVAGLFAMSRRVARRETFVLSLWSISLGVAALVGGLNNTDGRQIIEDILPYGLFTLGLVAGRAAERPRVVLILVLALCVADSLASLVKLAPVYYPGYRSTWVHGRIVTGVSILGIFVLMFVRKLDSVADPRRRKSWPIVAALYVSMLLATIGSGSRGMMLGWAVGIAVIAYVQRPSRALLATITVGLAYVAYDSVLTDVGIEYLRAGQVGTIDGRLDEVRDSLSRFAERPLFGCGLGATLPNY
jgi:O-antigen ligase